jgi:hypothetical protein
MGSEPFAALVQKIDWICYVLDHMGKCYDIEASGLGQVSDRPSMNIEPIALATRDSSRIRIDTRGAVKPSTLINAVRLADGSRDNSLGAIPFGGREGYPSRSNAHSAMAC